MGDSFQTIVDGEVALDEAQALADRTRVWLVEAGIVEASLTEGRVLGNDGLGYAAGPRAEQTSDGGRYEAAGLAIVVGRTAF